MERRTRFLFVFFLPLLFYLFFRFQLFREAIGFYVWGGILFGLFHTGAVFFINKRQQAALLAGVFSIGLVAFVPFVPQFSLFSFQTEAFAAAVSFFGIFIIVGSLLDMLLLFALCRPSNGHGTAPSEGIGAHPETLKLLCLATLFFWFAAGFGLLFSPVFFLGWVILLVLAAVVFFVTRILLEDLRERFSLSITAREILVFSFLFVLIFTEIVSVISFLPLPHLTIATILIILYYSFWFLLERRLRLILRPTSVLQVFVFALAGIGTLLVLLPWRL